MPTITCHITPWCFPASGDFTPFKWPIYGVRIAKRMGGLVRKSHRKPWSLPGLLGGPGEGGPWTSNVLIQFGGEIITWIVDSRGTGDIQVFFKVRQGCARIIRCKSIWRSGKLILYHPLPPWHQQLCKGYVSVETLVNTGCFWAGVANGSACLVFLLTISPFTRGSHPTKWIQMAHAKQETRPAQIFQFQKV